MRQEYISDVLNSSLGRDNDDDVFNSSLNPKLGVEERERVTKKERSLNILGI